MPIQVTMPRLSDTMEQGTVVKWHVKEGDSVSSGDVIADIETDKATMELQAFEDGKVAKIAIDEGQTADVGQLIVVLAEEGESVEDAAGAAESGGGSAKKQGSAEGKKSDDKGSAGGKKSDESDEAEDEDREERRSASKGTGGRSKEAEADSDEEGESSGGTTTTTKSRGAAASAGDNGRSSGGRIFASPLARKIAEEHGIDLSGVEGSGPSGRIVRKDVEAAMDSGSSEAKQREDRGKDRSAPSPAPVPPPGATLEARSVSLSNMRRTIAKRLVESKQTIPHYQVTVEADMGALLELREQLNTQLESQGVKLSVNDFLVRACALAMHQHPYVNSQWNESKDGVSIEIQEDVNVGVAVALPEERGGGLVVATLRNADRMGLRQISHETRRLAKKAREKGLTTEEMSDTTFTISNLGMFGVDHFTAIINPPNAAILAVGAAIEKPVVKDGQIIVGHRMAMTMSSDHRIVDGAMAAQYLQTVKQLLEQPATLLV